MEERDETHHHSCLVRSKLAVSVPQVEDPAILPVSLSPSKVALPEKVPAQLVPAGAIALKGSTLSSLTVPVTVPLFAPDVPALQVPLIASPF